MQWSLRAHFCLLGLLVLLASNAGTNHLPGHEPNAARLGRYGDPLPEGAVARLGTLRLVHLGGLASVAVSPDGKVIASGARQGKRVYEGGKLLYESDNFTLGRGETL